MSFQSSWVAKLLFSLILFTEDFNPNQYPFHVVLLSLLMC